MKPLLGTLTITDRYLNDKNLVPDVTLKQAQIVIDTHRRQARYSQDYTYTWTSK